MTSVWAGGRSPYAVNSKKFGMWLFIISDALTFSALLMAYTYVRLSTPNWPTPFHFSPSIIFSTVMTFCLLSSSLTMVMGVHAMNHGRRKAAVGWILATMVGGASFVALHLTEWLNLIRNEHVTPFDNPWGVPLFGGTFFALTGFQVLRGTPGERTFGHQKQQRPKDGGGEDQNLHETKQAQLTKDHRKGVEEDDFNVEDHEDHGHEVEPNRKSLRGLDLGDNPTLVRRHLGVSRAFVRREQC